MWLPPGSYTEILSPLLCKTPILLCTPTALSNMGHGQTPQVEYTVSQWSGAVLICDGACGGA